VYDTSPNQTSIGIYQTGPPRQLPPIPTNQRILTNEIYDKKPIYAELRNPNSQFKPIRPSDIQCYNKLSRNSKQV
jgi:hypothetical protein